MLFFLIIHELCIKSVWLGTFLEMPNADKEVEIRLILLSF